MEDQVEDAQMSLAKSFQSLFGKEELFAKVIECFPYPIQIYAPDGTSVLVNKAMLAEYHVISPDAVVGKYNVLKDPDVIATGQLPVLKEKRVIYVAAFLINRRVYRGKDEIAKANEYIESHWQEPFDAGATAKAACLSRAHFTKLFKKHTGITPHEYYINYKISKLKEKLLDTNLSIVQAFAACNMDYNGHSARLFREKVGVPPSVYRKMSE